MKKGALQSACTQLLISFLAILFIWEPIFSLAVFFPLTPAQAATTSGYQEDAVCKSRVLSYISLQAIASIDYTPSESEVTLEDDLGDYSPIIDQINLTELAKGPMVTDAYRAKILSTEYIKEVIVNFTNGTGTGMIALDNPSDNFLGSANDKLLFVCENAPKRRNFFSADGAVDYPHLSEVFNPVLSYSPAVMKYFSLLSDPSVRLGFKYASDRYYVFGENCPYFDPDYGQGAWTKDSNPCPNQIPGPNGEEVTNFSLANDIIPNGEWDAPKVSYKVVATLAYLLAPAEEGGAGREYIRVKMIKDPTGQNNFTEPLTIQTDTETDSATDLNAPDSTTGVDSQTESELDQQVPSSYSIDRTDPPYAPKKIAHAISIDQIDKVRVATKIVTKRLLGNNTTEYKVQAPFAINVAWQTNDGLTKTPAPDFSGLSMIQSSRFLLNATIVQMLNEMGLGDLDIDTSEMEINSFGDIAQVVGISLLEQLMGSSSGSLKGYDLTSTLRSVGLSYLEQNLGLVPGALGGDSNPLNPAGDQPTYDGVVENIGRATIEYLLGFPKRSLSTKTGTSSEIMESVGRSYLETQIFKVSSGTLTPSEGYPLKTVGDLLARLGEGRIEYVFKLPNQYMRQTEYKNVRLNYKSQLLFPAPSSTGTAGLKDADYGMDDYISNSLSLAYVPYKYAERNGSGEIIDVKSSDRSMYGFREDDFQLPVIKLATNPNSGELLKFKQLVGSRAIETSIGLFSQAGTTNRISKESLGADGKYLVPVGETVSGQETEYIQIKGKPTDATANPARDNQSFNLYPINVNNQPIYKTNIAPNSDTETVNWCNSLSTGLHRAPILDGSNWIAAANDLKDVDPNDPTTANRTAWKLDSDVYTRYSCKDIGAKAAQSLDLGLSENLYDLLINTNPVKHTTFLNQENAPQAYEFSERNREWRYNLATLLYYNDPSNYHSDDFNLIKSEANLFNAQGQLDQTDTTTANYLNILNQISDPDGLAARISWIRDLYNSRQSGSAGTTGNLFDLTPLTAINLTRAEINRGLAERYNSIAAHPRNDPNVFATQYNDPQFNGWDFVLSDLNAWLDCRGNNGLYQLNADKSAKICVNPNGAHLDSQRIQDTAQLLAKNINFSSYLTAISNSLTSGTIQNPDTAENNPATLVSNAQSMQAAAANLSSESLPIDANGRIDVTKALFSGDLMRMLISPDQTANGPVSLDASIEAYFLPYNNTATIPTWCSDPAELANPDNTDILWECEPDQARTPLSEVGRNYAARKFGNTEALAERTFMAQLRTDFSALEREANRAQSTIVDQANHNLSRMGLNDGTLLEKGLLNGDFQRIFMLDSANSVFERVGKEEVTRAIWFRTGSATKVTSSSQFQGILKDLNTVIQKIEFYQTRLQSIRKNSIELEQTLSRINAGLNTESAQLNQLGRQLSSARAKENGLTLSLDNAKSIQRRSQEYEPYVQKIRGTITTMEKRGVSLGEDYLKAKKLADTIMHEAEELAAGRSLPHKNQSEQEVRDALKAVKKDSRAKDDVCFTADELTATFAGGRELFQQAVSGRLESLGLRAGGCAIDKSFGLPANSMYTWYTLGQSQFPVMADHLSDEQLQTLLRQLTIPEESGDSADQNIDSFESETEEIVFYDLPIGTATPQNPELFETITNPDGSKQLRSRVPAWNKHEYNINNFKLAVGIADLYQKSKTSPHYESLVSDLNNFRLPELDSVDKINHVASSGFRIIQNTVIAKLLEMMPGFGRLMGRYRLTTQDFVKMMNGDMTPLIGKVGGYFLDNALEMPRGTGNALIYPPCLDLNGVSVKCDKLHGAESDPDNVRTRILAEVGLKKLGLYVPEIPANFNFFSPGNLLENWGNASISEALGLAPNSFKGLFSYDCYAATNTAQSNANNPLRCQNSQEALLKAFKLDTLPFVSSILRLQNSLLTQARSKLLGQYSTSQVGLEGARETAYQWYSTQINQLVRTYFEDLIFKKLQDPASDYWKATAKQPDFNALGTSLSGSDIPATTALLSTLWTLVSATAPTDTLGPVYDLDSQKVARRTILNSLTFLYPGWGDTRYKDSDLELTQDPNLPSPPNSTHYSTGEVRSSYLINTYASTLSSFKQRLDSANPLSLNSIYKLNDTKDLSFNGLLKGKINASEIAKSTGISESITTILGEKLNQFLDGSAPEWLKALDAVFQATTLAQCSKGERMGNFLAEMITGTGANCLNQLGKISSQDLLFNNSPEFRRLRSVVFERLLSNLFSAELEQRIGLQRGTFARIVDNPKYARQILLYEGVVMVADKVFGKKGLQDTCAGRGVGPNSFLPPANCSRATVLYAVREAFLAGFCDNSAKQQVIITTDRIDPNKKSTQVLPINCTLSYNSKRSATAFSNAMNTEIDAQLVRIGRKYIGAEISRADVDLLIHGDTRMFSYLALQFTAKKLNDALGRSQNGKDRNAHYFYINYNQIRSAVGLSSTTQEKQWIYNGQRIYLEARCSQIGLNSADCAALSSSELESKIKEAAGQSGSEVSFDQNQYLQAGQDELLRQRGIRRREAQELVKYAMLDMIAFQVDKSTPYNFTRRLLGSSSQDRTTAVEEYLFNHLLDSNSSVGNFMLKVCGGDDARKNGGCWTFVEQLYDAISHRDSSKWTALLNKDYSQFLDNLDSALTKKIAKLIGVNNLPPGMMKGLVLWGAGGFKWSDFNKDSVEYGGVKGAPLGRILENWGISQVGKWMDKQLGLKAGTGLKLIKLASDITQLYTLYSKITSYNAVEHAFSITGFQDNLSHLQDVEKAKKLAGDITSLVSEIVVSLYSEEFSRIDQDLGLPAGLSSLLAGAALTYAAYSIGHAVAPSAFSGSASSLAFGPAFFIGLGFVVVFGPTGIVVTNTAAGDGYYPFYTNRAQAVAEYNPTDLNYLNQVDQAINRGEACIGGKATAIGGCTAEKPYSQYIKNQDDTPIYEFDPTKAGSYRAGLKRTARTKVIGLLTNLAKMPYSQWATTHGYKHYRYSQSDINGQITTKSEYLDQDSNLWVSQLMTLGTSEFNPLTESEELTSWLYQPAPYSAQSGSYLTWGYGDPIERCQEYTFYFTNSLQCTERNLQYRDGFWAIDKADRAFDQIVDAVHIRL